MQISWASEHPECGQGRAETCWPLSALLDMERVISSSIARLSSLDSPRDEAAAGDKNLDFHVPFQSFSLLSPEASSRREIYSMFHPALEKAGPHPTHVGVAGSPSWAPSACRDLELSPDLTSYKTQASGPWPPFRAGGGTIGVHLELLAEATRLVVVLLTMDITRPMDS